jgi:hypothetical protein
MCIVHPVTLRLKVGRPIASGKHVFEFSVFDVSFIRSQWVSGLSLVAPGSSHLENDQNT